MLTLSLPTEDPAGLSVAAWRRIQAGQVVNSAAGVPRTGIITGAPLLVTGTSDQAMTYRIGQFVGASSRDGVGVEFTANDASDTVGTDIAPQANSRIDVIWFRARFSSLTDAGQTKPLFGVSRGIADANPQKPSIPAGAEELATAVVTSTDLVTQTVVITNTFRWTAMAGGVVRLRNSVEQAAWDAQEGDSVYRLDTKSRWQKVDGIWRQSRATVRRTRTQPLDVGNTSPVIDFDEQTSVSMVPDFAYNGGEFECQIPGEFLFTGQFSMKAAGANVGYTARVQRNGVNVVEAAGITSTIGSTSVSLVGHVSMAVGDKLRVLGYVNLNNPGAGVDVGQGKTYIAITRVG